MKVFAVYIKPKDANPMETATFVEEGFSFSAFVFNMFWAIYHRAWLAALVIFAVINVLSYLEIKQILSQEGVMALNIGLLLVVGFEASDWYQTALKRRGYILMDIVTGRNEEQAQQRFFDYYMTRKENNDGSNY